ncbi:MAG TPA: hypothetical protein VIF02_12975 [Methylocella sp.]|jgi:translation initiation factor RLI1|uniref:Uncharacterized protein n=1 Tax=freshwater sediment metagenome TaxID=556182 RepID=A0AA48RDI3_9ZZZZ
MRARRVLPYYSAKSFVTLVRRQSVFAVSEICKGLLIVGVGDLATADQFGDVIVIAWQTCGAYGLVSLQLLRGSDQGVSLALERAWAARQ